MNEKLTYGDSSTTRTDDIYNFPSGQSLQDAQTITMYVSYYCLMNNTQGNTTPALDRRLCNTHTLYTY